MGNSLGIVLSVENSPSTSLFSFVIDKEKKREVKKGMFVQTKSEEGIVFGYINEITRGNRYFERAESVAEYEKNINFSSHFPVLDWEYVIANVRVLGTVQKEEESTKQLRTSIPPFPGSGVFKADEELLKNFVGFEEDGLLLGKLQSHDLDAKIRFNQFLQKHFAVLAMSGAGKSYLMGVIIEELLDRKKEHGRVGIVLVDIHGEYTGFKSDPLFRDKTTVIDGSKIKVPFRKLTPGLIMSWFPDSSSDVQFSAISEMLHKMHDESKVEGKTFGLSDLRDRVFSAPEGKVKTASKTPLLRLLNRLESHRIIGSPENPNLKEAVKSGNLLILNLRDIDSLQKKQMIVHYVADRLFNLRKKEKVPPFLFVIEEAHNFAKEKAKRRACLSKPMIETIAREGRKFGSSLCLISQRPVNLSTTALSQCNSHIILRVTNPNDLDHIGRSSEGIDRRMLDSITTLQVGEAVIVGEAVKYPIFVEVRKRRSKHKSDTITLADMARKYEELSSEEEEMIEGYLDDE
ncbi:ATP-binding protein [Candidatus Micrarchaeota archaeon]|nr:ATP-binding protein [Candidatus Micrarchaeota archaeon]